MKIRKSIEELFKNIGSTEKAEKGEEELEILLTEGKINLTPADRVYLARYKNRPKGINFVENIIDRPVYLHGDRFFSEDPAILAGVGNIDGQVVYFISINKGRNTEESVKCNFGMVNPEGYRKAVRIMKLAEKFEKPLIIFIDTPGAYPGIGAEERGQAEAIARSIYTMTKLETKIISIITGEAASGGAIALGVCDYMLMMENGIYSILSPEGFASILWRDSSRAKEAMEAMKLTSEDLLKFGIIDEVVEEDLAIKKEDFFKNYFRLKDRIIASLKKLEDKPIEALLENRKNRFRNLIWD